MTIVLYEGVQFHDVTRVHGWVTGLYDGKIRLPLGSGLPSGAALEQLVVHEYAHAAIHELSRGRTPRWLQEGLAQYLEGVRVDPLLRGPGGLTLGGLEALIGDPDPARARVGYDIALKLGADVVVTLDADGQHVPGELAVVIGPIVRNEADYVNGSRLLGYFDVSDPGVVRNRNRPGD